MSDASSKSGGKKGKKGGKGARKGAEKEGKSFPRRPASAGSNSSAALVYTLSNITFIKFQIVFIMHLKISQIENIEAVLII